MIHSAASDPKSKPSAAPESSLKRDAKAEKLTLPRGGQRCSVCHSPRRPTLENAIRRGLSSAAIANSYGLSATSVRLHRVNHMADAAPERAREPLAPLAVVPPDATPLERARINCDDARAALAAAGAAGLPAGDIAKMRNAYTNAEKLYAQLAGSRALTPEAIVRTVGWAALAEEIREALRPFPDAAAAVLKAMRRP